MSTSPSSFSALHPRDALLHAHLKSSVLLAVYLIVGSALAIVSLVIVGYEDQLPANLAALPYASMFAMVLWFTLGAWMLGKQQRRLNRNNDMYAAYVQRHARPAAASTPAPASVEALTSDAPWELRAFWGNTQARAVPSHKPATYAQRSAQDFFIPAAAQMPRSLLADVAAERLHASDFVVAAVHRPERPTSLFGSAQ